MKTYTFNGREFVVGATHLPWANGYQGETVFTVWEPSSVSGDHGTITFSETKDGTICLGKIDTISCGGLDEETLPAPMTDERGAVIQAAYKKMKDLAEQVAKQFLIEHGVPEGVLTVQWPGEVVLPGDHRQILS